LIERLYFGRNSGDSLVVTDSAWSSFLAEVVTPRFPNGFTAWPAQGQWRGADGVLEREPSFVVELVHPDRADFDRALTEVVAEYKRRFRQQSVLRVRASARASF
jgi:Uma2 family endonuclease